MNPFRLIEMKYRVPALLLLWVNLAFVGCQSRPAPELHYYMLQPSVSDLSRGIVEVSRIELPAYLQSTSVMLAVSDYEIRPAQYHLWAEPLEEGIRRVLEAELSSQLKRNVSPDLLQTIEIEIEAFHGTESGKVVLRGMWRPIEPVSEPHRFSIETELEFDGYLSLVEAHVRALSVLVSGIVGVVQGN